MLESLEIRNRDIVRGGMHHRFRHRRHGLAQILGFRFGFVLIHDRSILAFSPNQNDNPFPKYLEIPFILLS